MAHESMKPLREKSDSEITEEVKTLREQLFKLKWQVSGGTAENPNRIRQVRRAIARHLTVLGERARAAGSGGTP